VISDIVIAAEPTAIPRVPDSERPWNKEVQARLQAAAEPLIAEGLRVHTIVRSGDPAGEIVRFAKEKGIDRIVIATHGNTGWRHLAFGSVTEKVVRIAACPVLTIRSTPTRPIDDTTASTSGYAAG
jgi:nucleotide-binding universal stress UspA family protein